MSSGTVGVGSAVKQMAKAITKNNMNNDFMMLWLSIIKSEAFVHKEIYSQNITTTHYYSHKKGVVVHIAS
jgi:hypothetical protein